MLKDTAKIPYRNEFDIGLPAKASVCQPARRPPTDLARLARRRTVDPPPLALRPRVQRPLLPADVLEVLRRRRLVTRLGMLMRTDIVSIALVALIVVVILVLLHAV